MKKITLLLALVCSMSLFATRYLVQTGAGGAATWRAAEAGETLVDLTVAGQSFNVWYTATVVANDEVWIAAGTYVLSGVVTIALDNHSVYGGFAGTETATSQRAKVVDGYPWEFTNETIFDGNNTVKIILAAAARSNVLFDGLTLKNSNTSNGVAQYRDGVTLQKCKVINNISTGNGGAINFYNGGSVYDSYIAGNVAVIGAGVYSNNASTVISVVSGCLIENNRANGTNGGGGIRVQGTGTGTTDVINCIIRGNKGLDDTGTTPRPGGAISTNSINNNFINCFVYNNQGSNSVYCNGGNFSHMTITNNVGGVYIASSSNTINLFNSVVWGNKTDALGETGISLFSNTGNLSVVINNTAINPAILPEYYTQANNVNIEADNDSEVGAKGPGFTTITTFWGAPVGETQTTELLAADWSIKYTSGLLNIGKTIASVTTDRIGTTRPQGSAYDAGAYELSYFGTTVTFNSGGTVTYNSNGLTSGAVLQEPEGKPLAFTITPNGGQQIASVKYNDVEVKEQLVEGVYTAPALSANATLVVEFSPTTSVNEIANSFVCFNSGNSVELRGISAGDQVCVYTVTGARLFNVKAVNSEMSLPVEKGIYLVRVADVVKKIVVD